MKNLFEIWIVFLLSVCVFSSVGATPCVKFANVCGTLPEKSFSPGKTFVCEPAGECAKSTESEYIGKLLVRGLEYLQYDNAAGKHADFKILYEVQRKSHRRRTAETAVFLTVFRNGKAIWKGRAACIAEEKYASRNFYPGLIVAALQDFGKERSGRRLSLGCASCRAMLAGISGR